MVAAELEPGRSAELQADGPAPHQGRHAAGRRVLARRPRRTRSRTAARTWASRSTRARSRPASSPATGTTPASTSCRAARSTCGPTTPAASTSSARRRRVRASRAPTPIRSATCRRRLRDGLEDGISLVVAKSVLGLLDAGVGPADDRAHRRRVRHALPRRRLGRGPHRARRDGEPAPPPRRRRPRARARARPRVRRARHRATSAPRFPVGPAADDERARSTRLAAWYRRFVDTRRRDAAERTLATALADPARPRRRRGDDVRGRHRPRVHRRRAHDRLHEQGVRGARPPRRRRRPRGAARRSCVRPRGAQRSEEFAEWRHPHDLAVLAAETQPRGSDAAPAAPTARRSTSTSAALAWAAARRRSARGRRRARRRARAGADRRAARPRARLRGRAAHHALPHAERPRRLGHRAPLVHRRQRAAPGAAPQSRRRSCGAAACTPRCASTSTASSTCPRARLPPATTGDARRARTAASTCRAWSTRPANEAYGFLHGGGDRAPS